MLAFLRLYPRGGKGQAYLQRFDLNFDENKKIEYFTISRFTTESGAILPSEQALLPVHLRDKSLPELVEHAFGLYNHIKSAEARDELVAMHAPQVMESTNRGVRSGSAEEYIDGQDKTNFGGYDPSRGNLYATNEDGSLRADIEEVVKGKTVRVAILVGPEMIRYLRSCL